jgi:hypothetical protein
MLSHDLRVEGALQKLHLSYHIDDDGDFALDWRLHDNRTQRIWIGSRTHQLGPFEIREVWSIVAYFPYIPSEKISRTLLEKNTLFKIGSFCYQKRNDGSYIVIFSARIPADLPPRDLGAVLLAVAQTADEAEKEIMGTDDF